jgi:7 transmembrane sweet-taste receptor of 3 GCPR
MFLDPYTQEWFEVFPFEYADGTYSPPELLRSPPDQNYLDPVAQGIGLSLMCIALFTIFAALVWVLVNRSHRVVIAAQPPFLYVLCLGATLSSLVILTQSFDESYGWTDDMLDKACLAMPWLVSLGVMVIYCALFTKVGLDRTSAVGAMDLQFVILYSHRCLTG